MHGSHFPHKGTNGVAGDECMQREQCIAHQSSGLGVIRKYNTFNYFPSLYKRVHHGTYTIEEFSNI